MGLFEQMGIDDQEEGVYDDFPAEFDITASEDYPVEDYEGQDNVQ